jgi:hypothetical protein
MSRLSNLKKQIILEANIKLSEQAPVANKTVTTPATPAKPTVDNANLQVDYNTVMASVWYEVRNNIVIGGQANGKSTGIMQWTYPVGNTEPKVQLHKQDGSVADQAVLDSYNKMFNDKLKLASNDNAWLTKIAGLSNSKNKDKNKNINFQTYILNNIQDKSLVKNNGTEGQPFNDGVFYAITLKAAINFRLQNGYRDTEWMKANLGGI